MGRKIKISILLEEAGEGMDVTIQTPLDALTLCKILSKVVADQLDKFPLEETKILPANQVPRWPTN